MKKFVTSFYAFIFILSAFSQQPVWQSLGTITNVNQFDADFFGDKFYIISDKYYELDLSGNIIYEDASIKDDHTGSLDFSPAIKIGHDGSVHIITRGSGSWDGGYELFYTKLDTNHNIVEDKLPIGEKVARNYTVDLVELSDGSILYTHTKEGESGDVTRGIHFYHLQKDISTHLGTIPYDYWRADGDYKIYNRNDTIYLASVHPYTAKPAFLFYAPFSQNLIADLQNNILDFTAGDSESRRIWPNISFTQNGDMHFSYGSFHQIYYNRLNQQTPIYEEDKLIFANLEDWHLFSGLSTICSSPDGNTVLTVAIEANNSKTVANGSLQYAYTVNGGENWTYPKRASLSIAAGEGRMRPRLFYLNNKFYLVYFDAVGQKITMATIEIASQTPAITSNPYFNPQQGVHDAPIDIEILHEKHDAVIHYTIDGTNPTIASPIYSSPISTLNDLSIKSIAFIPGGLPSQTVQADYKLMYVAPPVIIYKGEIVSSRQLISLSTETIGAEIFYTTNGDTPDITSEKFTGRNFYLDTNTQLKAIAYKEEIGYSEVTEIIISGIQNEMSCDLQVYPNPARDYLTISGTENVYFIELIDFSGKCIMHFGKSDISTKVQLDVTGLKPGVYSINLISIDSQYRKTLIVN